MKRLLKLSDEEILQRYKQTENPEYFMGLYCRYIPLLYGVCLKYLQDVRKSQEAVKQIYEMLLPVIVQENVETFRPWIYSVTKNYCLQLCQKKKPEIKAETVFPLPETTIVQRLLNKEDLKRCMRQLPVEQRIAIIRFFDEEMSYRDIVSSMGYELNPVKNLIRKGIHSLKNCMEEEA